MTERERIIEKMAMAMRVTESAMVLAHEKRTDWWEQLADAALRVIEAPPDPADKPTRICNCGQNGFPENSPYSNHPHASDCPQYSGK
jgi:hypothetical protein